MRKYVKTLESISKPEEVCQNIKKCGKAKESSLKPEKLWQSMLKQASCYLAFCQLLVSYF
jgi:hypothetical protein